ncbi:tetratricopeptide repeat protein [Terasakiella sp. SH-1]|uniref:tetratricopeptide repeat protein n=1 Tax=Terasakiella sp. SH-1 TaxID=2560057 RepID=UPI001073FC9D|nr:tetratricopeptide repeat protein [Terasakiella sp. SH-1]
MNKSVIFFMIISFLFFSFSSTAKEPDYASGILKRIYKPINKNLSIEEYERKAVEEENALLMLSLMEDYEAGFSVQRSREKALYWLKKAVSLNNLTALYILDGVERIGGSPSFFDIPNWFDLYEKAAYEGDIEAAFRRCIFGQTKSTAGHILRFCNEFSQKGHGGLSHYLGQIYEYSQFLKSDEFESRIFYPFIYDFSLKAPTDIPRAIQYYQRGAKEGHKHAQADFAYWLYVGRAPLEADPKQAQVFAQLSTDQGSIHGQTHLGLILYKENQKQKAVKLLKEAAYEGNGTAACGLSSIYLFDNELNDDVEAIKWIHLAFWNRDKLDILYRKPIGLVYTCPKLKEIFELWASANDMLEGKMRAIRWLKDLPEDKKLRHEAGKFVW